MENDLLITNTNYVYVVHFHKIEISLNCIFTLSNVDQVAKYIHPRANKICVWWTVNQIYDPYAPTLFFFWIFYFLLNILTFWRLKNFLLQSYFYFSHGETKQKVKCLVTCKISLSYFTVVITRILEMWNAFLSDLNLSAS